MGAIGVLSSKVSEQGQEGLEADARKQVTSPMVENFVALQADFQHQLAALKQLTDDWQLGGDPSDLINNSNKKIDLYSSFDSVASAALMMDERMVPRAVHNVDLNDKGSWATVKTQQKQTVESLHNHQIPQEPLASSHLDSEPVSPTISESPKLEEEPEAQERLVNFHQSIELDEPTLVSVEIEQSPIASITELNKEEDKTLIEEMLDVKDEPTLASSSIAKETNQSLDAPVVKIIEENAVSLEKSFTEQSDGQAEAILGKEHIGEVPVNDVNDSSSMPLEEKHVEPAELIPKKSPPLITEESSLLKDIETTETLPDEPVPSSPVKLPTSPQSAAVEQLLTVVKSLPEQLIGPLAAALNLLSPKRSEDVASDKSNEQGAATADEKREEIIISELAKKNVETEVVDAGNGTPSSQSEEHTAVFDEGHSRVQILDSALMASGESMDSDTPTNVENVPESLSPQVSSIQMDERQEDSSTFATDADSISSSIATEPSASKDNNKPSQELLLNVQKVEEDVAKGSETAHNENNIVVLPTPEDVVVTIPEPVIKETKISTMGSVTIGINLAATKRSTEENNNSPQSLSVAEFKYVTIDVIKPAIPPAIHDGNNRTTRTDSRSIIVPDFTVDPNPGHDLTSNTTHGSLISEMKPETASSITVSTVDETLSQSIATSSPVLESLLPEASSSVVQETLVQLNPEDQESLSNDEKNIEILSTDISATPVVENITEFTVTKVLESDTSINSTTESLLNETKPLINPKSNPSRIKSATIQLILVQAKPETPSQLVKETDEPIDRISPVVEATNVDQPEVSEYMKNSSTNNELIVNQLETEFQQLTNYSTNVPEDIHANLLTTDTELKNVDNTLNSITKSEIITSSGNIEPEKVEQSSEIALQEPIPSSSVSEIVITQETTENTLQSQGVQQELSSSVQNAKDDPTASDSDSSYDSFDSVPEVEQVIETPSALSIALDSHEESVQNVIKHTIKELIDIPEKKIETLNKEIVTSQDTTGQRSTAITEVLEEDTGSAGRNATEPEPLSLAEEESSPKTESQAEAIPDTGSPKSRIKSRTKSPVKRISRRLRSPVKSTKKLAAVPRNSTNSVNFNCTPNSKTVHKARETANEIMSKVSPRAVPKESASKAMSTKKLSDTTGKRSSEKITAVIKAGEKSQPKTTTNKPSAASKNVNQQKPKAQTSGEKNNVAKPTVLKNRQPVSSPSETATAVHKKVTPSKPGEKNTITLTRTAAKAGKSLERVDAVPITVRHTIPMKESKIPVVSSRIPILNSKQNAAKLISAVLSKKTIAEPKNMVYSCPKVPNAAPGKKNVLTRKAPLVAEKKSSRGVSAATSTVRAAVKRETPSARNSVVQNQLINEKRIKPLPETTRLKAEAARKKQEIIDAANSTGITDDESEESESEDDDSVREIERSIGTDDYSNSQEYSEDRTEDASTFGRFLEPDDSSGSERSLAGLDSDLDEHSEALTDAEYMLQKTLDEINAEISDYESEEGMDDEQLSSNDHNSENVLEENDGVLATENTQEKENNDAAAELPIDETEGRISIDVTEIANDSPNVGMQMDLSSNREPDQEKVGSDNSYPASKKPERFEKNLSSGEIDDKTKKSTTKTKGRNSKTKTRTTGAVKSSNGTGKKRFSLVASYVKQFEGEVEQSIRKGENNEEIKEDDSMDKGGKSDDAQKFENTGTDDREVSRRVPNPICQISIDLTVIERGPMSTNSSGQNERYHLIITRREIKMEGRKYTHIFTYISNTLNLGFSCSAFNHRNKCTMYYFFNLSRTR